jgi:hypothetical protein
MIDLNLNVPDLLALKGSPLAPESNFDELRLADVPKNASQISPDSTFDPLIHFVGRTNINFIDRGATPKPSILKDASPFIDRKSQKVTSSNKQLTLDYKIGLLTVNAPQAQGASGNLKAAGQITLPALTITSDLDLAHIILVSLDDQPLATSSKMLLQVMSEEKPKNFATEDNGATRKITNIGHDPWLIKPLQATIHLTRPDAATFKAQPLDPNFLPTTSPVQPANEIHLTPTTLYYLITK